MLLCRDRISWRSCTTGIQHSMICFTDSIFPLHSRDSRMVHYVEDGVAPKMPHSGNVFKNLAVRIAPSLDEKSRQTFHPFNIGTHLFGPFPDWYYNYSKHAIQTGYGCCSELSISFHFVEPMMMRQIEFILYHLKVYH